MPARAERGQWTPLDQLYYMRGIAVHMALVPGAGADHSRVVWWETGTKGGVLGWSPGNDGCTNWPSNFTVRMGPAPTDSLPTGAVVWNPGANTFCGGLTQLANGDLLTIGGQEGVQEHLVGLARIFSYGGTGNGSWSEKETMGARRWYPTGTTLGGKASQAQGRVLACGGSMYSHLWFFGGYRDGSLPNSPVADSLFRYGWPPNGIWDPSVRPAGIAGAQPPGDRPVPRVAHSAVFLQDKVAEAYFGGKDAQGNTVDVNNPDVWLLARDNGQATDADYHYSWDKVAIDPNFPTRPEARHEHIALALSPTEMVIFGGARKDSGGAETVRNDFWHLRKDGQTGKWRWFQITAPDAPSARFGHAAVYDAANRRMLLFGGTDASGQTTDSKAYFFTFTHTVGSEASGSWSVLTLDAGSRIPDPRRDHIMVWAEGYGALMYSGLLGTGATSDTLWRLNLSGTVAWSPLSTEGTPPGARAGHAAVFTHDVTDEGEFNRLYICGGDQLPSGEDRHVYKLELDFGGTSTWEQWQEEVPFRLSQHTANLDRDRKNEANLVYARIPEIYDPATNTWTAQSGAPMWPVYYPVQFVVPGSTTSGSRVLRVEQYATAYSRYLDTPVSGQQGSWQPFIPPSPHQNDGIPHFKVYTGVMYQPGKLMVAGGEPEGDNPNFDAVGTTKTLDSDLSTRQGWVARADMSPRISQNLVLLPTGEVLAVGGNGHVLSPPAVPCPQLWNANDYTWACIGDLACDQIDRNYHSTALLLPDGRVLTAGGSGESNTAKVFARIFCPPYLFKANGNLAAPPEILCAPATITWGQRFTIRTDQAAQVTRVSLIRPAATTHSFDQNQRYVPLTNLQVLTNPSRLIVTAPASPDSAPPGYYLLFLTGSADGPDVPSLDKWVKVQGGAAYDDCDEVAPATTSNLSGTALFAECDVLEGRVQLSWTAPADDGSQSTSGPANTYDVRYSQSSITEANWGSATQVTGEPAPGDPGHYPESTVINGLEPSTGYYFALKTKDDLSASGAWSGLSNVVSVTTKPPRQCDGFSGGGGGGGGSLTAGDWAQASVATDEGASVAGIDNSLFEGAASSTVHDMLPLPGLDASGDAYRVLVRSAGAQKGAMDKVALLIADHAATERAVVLGDGVVSGLANAASAVLLDSGKDLTAALATQPYAASAGQAMTVMLGAGGTSRILLLEAARAGSPGMPEACGILVRVPDGASWRTVAHLYPRRASADLAADIGAAAQVRLEFLSAARLRFAGELTLGKDLPTLTWASLQSAAKGTQSDLAAAVGGADGSTVGFAGGDTLQLAFGSPALETGKARDVFLWVEGALAAPSAAALAQSAPTASEAPAQFALYSARPNPFTQRTVIRFALPVASPVRLEVFDVQGRRLVTLRDGSLRAGYHAVEWDGQDGSGMRVPPGTYFCRLAAGSFEARRKLTLAR